jgi:hypothetical protein
LPPATFGLETVLDVLKKEILQQARARSSILDQDRGRFVLLGEVLTFRRRWIYLDLLQMRSA